MATGRLVADISRMKPVKRSVAVLVRNGDFIFSTRRPDDDDELPGVWGLPAGSFRGTETLQDLISRIGIEKLGVRLIPHRKLSQGRQERPAYLLQMELWEVTMEGVPVSSTFRWAPLDSLEPGAADGSLCCALALRTKWQKRSRPSV